MWQIPFRELQQKYMMTEVKFNGRQAFTRVQVHVHECTLINYYHHCYKLTVACHSD